MKITNVKLFRFKRFTETTISDIPETAKLVVIAGPNGSGKSSLFEAFNVWSRAPFRGLQWTSDYYIKGDPEPEFNTWQKSVKIQHDKEGVVDLKKAIYIRSAYRNEPEFQLTRLERQQPAIDEDRLARLINNDATVRQNYQRLVGKALEDVFETEKGSTTIDEFRNSAIGEIKSATMRLFPKLIMNSLGNPFTTGTFKFDKGSATAFSYMNLSGGEKAAFDLLLDILVKRREYDDTVFCIDEPEAHMNSKLQGALLQELYDALGENCQLWLATHSAGMMRRARDIEHDCPGSVVFLDFGGRDFDAPQIISPERPTRVFWERVLDVAFDDFASLMAPREVVICEGSRIGEGGQSENIDARIYEEIFSEEFPECRFIPGGNNKQVENDRLALVSAMQSLVRGTKVRRLIDRDDLSDVEMAERRDAGVSVLQLRNLESYLFSDEVIRLLYERHGRPELAEPIIEFKRMTMASASKERSRAPDDVKSSAGPLMEKIKRDLSLTQCGGNVKQFMRTTLVPLIETSTDTYGCLKESIFPSAPVQPIRAA